MTEIDIGLCGNQHICENDTDYIMKIPNSDYDEDLASFYLMDNVRKNKSFKIWDMIRALNNFILKDESDVIDHMGYDFKLNIHKSESYIPECIETYNKWLVDFIQLLKEENNFNELAENNIEYFKRDYISLRRINGFFNYNVNPKICDITEADCQCIIKMIFDDEKELKLERHPEQKSEFTLYVPEPDEHTSWYWVMLEKAREYGFSKVAIPILSHSKQHNIDTCDIESAIMELMDWLYCNQNYSMEVILCCPDEETLIETIKFIEGEENY